MNTPTRTGNPRGAFLDSRNDGSGIVTPPTEQQRRAAAVTCADRCTDRDDLRQLLAALALDTL